MNGTHTSYPALEVWLYEDGYRPLLLYLYNPRDYKRGLFHIMLKTSL